MLPANISELKNALQRTKEFANSAASDRTYLKMDKGGNWTIGSDALEVEPTSEWAVNPATFATGYSAFDDKGVRQGEEMALLTEAPITTANLPHVNAPWVPQIGVELKCLKGDDQDQEAMLYQRSRDGMKSLGNVLNEIMLRVDADDENCVPVITLGSSKYRHKTYGVIYSGDFQIVRWLSANSGEVAQETVAEEVAEEVEAEAVAEEANPPATRRRRRAAA